MFDPVEHDLNNHMNYLGMIESRSNLIESELESIIEECGGMSLSSLQDAIDDLSLKCDITTLLEQEILEHIAGNPRFARVISRTKELFREKTLKQLNRQHASALI